MHSNETDAQIARERGRPSGITAQVLLSQSSSPGASSGGPSLKLALCALLLACFGEGIGFPLMKAFALRCQVVAPGASDWLASGYLLSGRFLLAAAVLLAFERNKPTRLELTQGLWIGAFAGAGHVLQADGLAFTDASTSAFLTQGYVVVLPLLAAFAQRRLPAGRVAGAVLVNVLGLGILARFDPRLLSLGRGEAETLLAAVLFAGQIFSISRPLYAENRAGPVTVVMFVTIGAGSLALTAHTGSVREVASLSASLPLGALLLALTLLSTLMPFLLMNRYQRHVSPAEAGVIYGAEPVMASLLALFVPALLTPLAGQDYVNERLSLRLVAGAALVTLSPFLLRRGTGEQPVVAESS